MHYFIIMPNFVAIKMEKNQLLAFRKSSYKTQLKHTYPGLKPNSYIDAFKGLALTQLLKSVRVCWWLWGAKFQFHVILGSHHINSLLFHKQTNQPVSYLVCTGRASTFQHKDHLLCSFIPGFCILVLIIFNSH